MDVAGSIDPLLATERVQLRPWRDADADRLFDIRRREEVAKWLGDPTPWPDIALAHKKIAAWSKTIASDGPLGVWAIAPRTDNRQPVGSVSVAQLPASAEIEIGWYLHPDSVGQGFAAEAAKGLLDHVLGAGATRVWALMWPNNLRSARVARSIGMHDLGVIQDPWYGTDEEPMSQMFQGRP